MTRKEVRHYIGLSLRIFRSQEMDEDKMIENIIDAVSGSSFFSYTSFVLGFLIGILIYSIYTHYVVC